MQAWLWVEVLDNVRDDVRGHVRRNHGETGAHCDRTTVAYVLPLTMLGCPEEGAYVAQWLPVPTFKRD